ncbi:MAG: glutamate-1-semialdehyde 2,1-aminomutase [Phycisphaerae bacterium]|nr:glutamate-1-semialdehyde 2,1-aminomutase [Phycisphaerae bacterium]NIP54319.1 glutamate-1-semialdehyde 2,1-aminomutase [Phycisphaerae bacterium]NIS53188.1 glutamate-1-semialdehyde 2,1-aminomutase [Phycisphaerae bacterium]NIU10673.1 glutamate-1-semialdehyde 2,1-aminomutase [Phycisphaerae bacterium]NIU58434.1 glutamate-1-semialdehyde 2,1-aminomutase [Phycisphaerae bacterium]
MDEKKTNYPKSARAFSQAVNFLPGGVNSPVRAFGGVDIGPIFIDRAAGSKIYDIDGNEYIDYVCSWGPMILGHAHPGVLEAVQEAVKKGTSFGAPTLAETQLAEKIIAAFDSIEKVRLVSSGTEAVMSAIRLARSFTKKDLVIKMAGCYHGHSDSLLVAAGSGLAETGTPSSAGVPDAIANLTIVIPYNDIDAVKKAFQMHAGKIAAVLVEPVAANMGVVPPIAGYLQTLRDLCDNDNALLIFDEVITGFRLAVGGAQQLFSMNADITCLGKIIGGGLPAAAVGGRADIMNTLAPGGPVYQAGTLSGNPIATAAANATLDILTQPDCYQKLESSAAMLEAGLAGAAKDANIPVTINRVGSIMSCFFTDKPIRNFTDVQSTNIKRFKSFFADMLSHGIYLAPSAYEAMFVSLAHSQQDIEKTVEAAKNTFQKLKD